MRYQKVNIKNVWFDNNYRRVPKQYVIAFKMNMTEENISQEFRLKNIHEKIKGFIEEIKQNELISKKYKNVCKTLYYIEQLVILNSTLTGCVSIYTCA